MNKIILSSIIVGIATMMLLSVLPAMAAQNGSITNIFPPDKKGQSHGVGMITGDDGKKYVFRTPSDNNGEVLTKGNVVTFVVTNGRHVTNVVVTLACTPSTCLPPFPP